MSDKPIKLSICIPTHQGRGWCLKEALDSIIADIQASRLQDAVEICVSDNASTDETRAVVEAARERTPGLITYFRFPLNVGIFSWFNVVEMARGEYCWLFGSDDIIEPGAIHQALDRLERYPNCAGLTAAYEHYNFSMERKLPLHPLAYYPVDYARERMITGFDQCLYQLSMAQGFMSVQIFRRDLWLSVVADEPPEFVFYAWNYTHAYVLARMLQREPGWVWAPFTAVRMRGENGEVALRLNHKAYALPLAYLRDMTSLWSRVCGRNRATYRRLLTKAMLLSWSPTVVRHIKLTASHDSRDDVVLLGQFIRYLWSLPQFWLRTFPALLIPNWFWKMLSSGRAYTAIKQRLHSRRVDS